MCRTLGVSEDRMRFEAMYPMGSLGKDLHEMFRSFDPEFFNPDEGLEQIPELDELFFMIVQQTANHVIVIDPEGVILYVNHAAEETTGYSSREMYGQTPRLWGGLMPLAFYKKLWGDKENGKNIVCELLNRRKDGQLYVALARITPIIRQGKVIAYVATEEDVTEFRRLDKAKTEFIFLASHQLLTPLSAIGWYAEMLVAGDAGRFSLEQRKYLQEILDGDRRMVSLINALLNVSRIEMGTFIVDPKPTDLEALLHSVLDELKSGIITKQLTIQHTCVQSAPSISADPNLLRMVFQNLLSNAVKYTPVRGQITCVLVFGKDEVEIRVGDTGIGIPKDQQGKIFEKLFRADNAKKSDTEGTGLGLYIVKSIMDAFGGRVWFESEEGKGTTFHVSLSISGMKKREGTRALKGGTNL
ncbi:MAG: PAS domain-containing sensor histidine kinase [Patescibacteria group bacterium]